MGSPFLLWTNLTIREAAKVIRTAEELSLEDWHLVAAAPLAYRRDFAVEEENKILGQMKVLRSLQIQTINLSIASKKATGDKRRKGDALPTAREQRVVARIKDNAGKDFAFDKCAFFFLDELRRAGSHIKNFDVLQRVSERAVGISIDWLAHFEHESVVPLIVKRTQIICFVIKTRTAERKTSIEEVRFGDRQNKILSLGSVLKT